MVKRTGLTKKNKPACGLCGKSKKLVQSECCGKWICDDHDKYVLFSYSRKSCARNHSRFTLCGFHFNEGHKGDWKDCPKCRKAFETEMYVWYGTNEYNFEKLPDPPSFKPTKCRDCGIVINLGSDGYMRGSEGYRCEKCGRKAMHV